MRGFDRPRVGALDPKPWRVAVETATVVHIGVWLLVGAVDSVADSVADAVYWGQFAFMLAPTALFAVMAALMPRRRPAYPDRLFGEGYRRVEMRAAYILRLETR